MHGYIGLFEYDKGFHGSTYQKRFEKMRTIQSPREMRKYARDLKEEAKRTHDLRLFRFSLKVLDAAIALERGR